MEKAKQWIALSLVGVLAVLAAGWFLLIAPKRTEAADLRAQSASQDQSNNALRARLLVLKAQQKALPAQQASLAAVAAKIPDNPALPSLVRALTKAADEAGIELISMSPSTPAAVAAAAATGTAPVAKTGPAQVAAKKVGTPTATTPGAASSAAAGAAAAGTLQAVTLNLAVAGRYFDVARFLDQLENLTRAFKVTNLTMLPGANPMKPVVGALPDTSMLNAAITGLVYLAPGRVVSAVPVAPVAPVKK